MSSRPGVPAGDHLLHCQRVAAWSCELGRALRLPESDLKLVEQAALLHHFPQTVMEDDVRRRLLADLHLEETPGQGAIPDDVRSVLEAFGERRSAADATIAKLGAILEISDDFDQYFESEPLLDPEADCEYTRSAVKTMSSYLQVSSREDVIRVINRLPVFPRAARDVVKCASDPEAGVRELQAVASKDPILAATVVRTANSAFFSPVRPISSIQHAVSYIGLPMARKVMLAASFRPSFLTARLRALWNHCLDVAQIAEDLARCTKQRVDPSEAFLAGLVHDIGRLAFSIMPAAFLDRFYRLTLRGCPPVEVETCLSGLCHGEVGAEALRQWKFPGALVEAVRWHHRPEKSSGSLASLLYLSEYWSDSEEDLPSCVRLREACERTGITLDALAGVGRERRDSLECLRFAA